MRDPFLERPFRAYIRLHWRTFVAGFLSLLATNSLDALAPLLIGGAIDQIVELKEFSSIARQVGLILLVTGGLAICRFLWRFFWGQFHHSVAEDLRNRLFAKFTELGPAFFQKRPTGELMSLINNDVNSFRMGIGPGLLVLFDSIFILIIVPILMWQISPNWTWRSLVLMPLVPFVAREILRRTHSAYERQQTMFGAMASSAQEIVSGIRVIKSFAQEENQTRLFNVQSRNFQLACNDVARTDASFGPILEVAAGLGSVILILIGAPDVMKGTVSVGLFFAFFQYVQKMVWPMEGLGISFSQFQVGRAAFQRIRETLETDSDTADCGTLEMSDLKKLEVRNLNFSYPGDESPALRNVSFTLKKGEILGVVGPTGAGKTTLAELLCRLYPVREDEILINGASIENITKKSLRKLIGMVPQDTFVFSRKLADNIRYFEPTTGDDVVYEHSALVKLDEDVRDWPEGYETVIGEKGVNLSGGQRQRVTLARALLAQAPLVIVDDALSAVDAKTGIEIIGNLRRRLRTGSQCAAIVISHRLANVSWADRILVLKDGQVEALGKHEELLYSSPTYQHLFDLQNAGGVH